MSGSSIIILGAGVAGMAAARRLRLCGHAPRVISPPAAVPNRGETLSVRALPLLETLDWSGLLDNERAAPGAGRYSVWGSARLRRAEDQQDGYHLDRRKFEAAMATDLFGQGVERLEHSATAIEHLPHGVAVTLDTGQRLEAAALIDATGRAALSSGAAAGRRRLDRLVACYRILDIPPDADVAPATLIEAVPLGWWYMAPLPEHRMMVGLFTDSDLVPSGFARSGAPLTALALETSTIGARLDSLELAEALSASAPEIVAAATVINARLYEGRIIRAGDAAAATDPLAANGLTAALWSGIKAADAALDLTQSSMIAADAYEAEFLKGLADQLGTQHAMYSSERRFPNAPFWTRR